MATPIQHYGKGAASSEGRWVIGAHDDSLSLEDPPECVDGFLNAPCLAYAARQVGAASEGVGVVGT